MSTVWVWKPVKQQTINEIKQSLKVQITLIQIVQPFQYFKCKHKLKFRFF